MLMSQRLSKKALCTTSSYRLDDGELKMAALPPGGVVVEGAVYAAAAVVLLQPVPQPPELGVAVGVLGGEAAAEVVPEAGRDARVAGEPLEVKIESGSATILSSLVLFKVSNKDKFMIR